MRYVFTGLMLLFSVLSVQAQDKGFMNAHVNEKGDTVFEASIDAVTIIDKRHFESNLDKSNFNKLKRNVYAVYPYAQMAGEIYLQMHADMDELDKRRKRKKYKKATQKDLEAEFEDKLRDLTVTQGRILVQLINRETGNNCYQLIKELKSPIAAWTWQLVAKRWDYDLKAAYVPADNPDLELILQMIEAEELTQAGP